MEISSSSSSSPELEGLEGLEKDEDEDEEEIFDSSGEERKKSLAGRIFGKSSKRKKYPKLGQFFLF